MIPTTEQILGLYNYWIVIILMMTGFYIVIARTNLIQKVIGLNIFQISVFLLYITMGKVTGGTAPIIEPHEEHGHSPAATEAVDAVAPSAVDHAGEVTHEVSATAEQVLYTHPLPSVLMLTAIVVGVATTALALALIIRIHEAYGTIEEDEILQRDREAS